ncbi:hypothetical protein CAEBREN_24997 [Caenorhabditis brenneri]|uniref:Uncharacterized protein n=1 Tax=Caenorhabditis brenneri TaxID=135651 RepID=G0N5W0_CAEBE|nr:hypothetical protein CAEBREN_24997 [Caenorhabditis brenneri]
MNYSLPFHSIPPFPRPLCPPHLSKLTSQVNQKLSVTLNKHIASERNGE